MNASQVGRERRKVVENLPLRYIIIAFKIPPETKEGNLRDRKQTRSCPSRSSEIITVQIHFSLTVLRCSQIAQEVLLGTRGLESSETTLSRRFHVGRSRTDGSQDIKFALIVAHS